MDRIEKRYFLSITVLISALAFNPLAATEVSLNVTQNSSRSQADPLGNTLASHLYKRGLDEDAAQALSNKFIDAHHNHLDDMIHHLVQTSNSLSHDEILEHLSREVLYRRNVDLSSYDHLVSMLTKIKGRTLSSMELKQLQRVSKHNQMYV